MTKKLTQKEFETRILNKYGDKYTILGKYINSSTPIELIHNKCGRIIFPRPNDLFNNDYYCNECRKDSLNHKRSSKDFNDKINKLSSGRLSLVSDYLGFKEKVTIHCSKHNIDYKTVAINVTRKDRVTCPCCIIDKKRESQVKDTTVFLSELYKSHNGNIVACEDYVNTHTKINFKCLVCGNIFKSEPNSVIRVSGCPYCKQYKGEVIIANHLKKSGIEFETQKKFKGLKDSRSLSYDFYIPNQKIIIEYNGEQHYRPIEFFGGEIAFKKQQHHDYIKRKYAIDNGFTLLSIRNTDKVEDITSQIDSIVVN